MKKIVKTSLYIIVLYFLNFETLLINFLFLNKENFKLKHKKSLFK
jgi:hypothetical protein